VPFHYTVEISDEFEYKDKSQVFEMQIYTKNRSWHVTCYKWIDLHQTN